jgi:hypothetical protein
MSPEESRQRASELFDESKDRLDLPMLETSADWETWTLIATQLESAEVVAIPGNFAIRVQRAIRRARFWNDVLLIMKVSSVTAVVVTFVVAGALGLDWWHRLSAAVKSVDAVAGLQTLLSQGGTLLAALTPLLRVGERIWPFVPFVLISIAIAAVVAELVIFRFLRLGPFRAKSI